MAIEGWEVVPGPGDRGEAQFVGEILDAAPALMSSIEERVIRAFSVPGMILGPEMDPPEISRIRQMTRLGYFNLPRGGIDHVAVRRAIDEAAGR